MTVAFFPSLLGYYIDVFVVKKPPKNGEKSRGKMDKKYSNTIIRIYKGYKDTCLSLSFSLSLFLSLFLSFFARGEDEGVLK